MRQVRQFTGIKNPVAKITGSGLNRRGVLASAEKLAGKDLMVEEAGDLDPGTIGELERLMSRDNTGMRVVLIDNPKQIEMLEKRHSSLAEWFEFIREEDVVEVPVEVYPEDTYSEDAYPETAYSEEPASYDPYVMPENQTSQIILHMELWEQMNKWKCPCMRNILYLRNMCRIPRLFCIQVMMPLKRNRGIRLNTIWAK